jgi:hypothetical protein
VGKRKSIRSSMTSKGERRNQVNGVKEMRRARSPFEKEANKRKAWKKGLNPWVTIPGPSSNMRFIRARANAVWGDPKKQAYGIYGKGSGDE